MVIGNYHLKGKGLVAEIHLDRPGQWFFRTHFIRPARNAKKSNLGLPRADWESFWVPITFRVHERPAKG